MDSPAFPGRLSDPTPASCLSCFELGVQLSQLQTEHEHLTFYWHEAEKKCSTVAKEVVRWKVDAEKKLQDFITVTGAYAELKDAYTTRTLQLERMQSSFTESKQQLLQALKTDQIFQKELRMLIEKTEVRFSRLKKEASVMLALLIKHWSVEMLKSHFEESPIADDDLRHTVERVLLSIAASNSSKQHLVTPDRQTTTPHFLAPDGQTTTPPKRHNSLLASEHSSSTKQSLESPRTTDEATPADNCAPHANGHAHAHANHVDSSSKPESCGPRSTSGTPNRSERSQPDSRRSQGDTQNTTGRSGGRDATRNREETHPSRQHAAHDTHATGEHAPQVVPVDSPEPPDISISDMKNMEHRVDATKTKRTGRRSKRGHEQEDRRESRNKHASPTHDYENVKIEQIISSPVRASGHQMAITNSKKSDPKLRVSADHSASILHDPKQEKRSKKSQNPSNVNYTPNISITNNSTPINSTSVNSAHHPVNLQNQSLQLQTNLVPNQTGSISPASTTFNSKLDAGSRACSLDSSDDQHAAHAHVITKHVHAEAPHAESTALGRTGRMGLTAPSSSKAPGPYRERRNPKNMSRTRPKRDASCVVNDGHASCHASDKLKRTARMTRMSKSRHRHNETPRENTEGEAEGSGVASLGVGSSNPTSREFQRSQKDKQKSVEDESESQTDQNTSILSAPKARRAFTRNQHQVGNVSLTRSKQSFETTHPRGGRPPPPPDEFPSMDDFKTHATNVHATNGHASKSTGGIGNEVEVGPLSRFLAGQVTVEHCLTDQNGMFVGRELSRQLVREPADPKQTGSSSSKLSNTQINGTQIDMNQVSSAANQVSAKTLRAGRRCNGILSSPNDVAKRIIQRHVTCPTPKTFVTTAIQGPLEGNGIFEERRKSLRGSTQRTPASVISPSDAFSNETTRFVNFPLPRNAFDCQDASRTWQRQPKSTKNGLHPTAQSMQSMFPPDSDSRPREGSDATGSFIQGNFNQARPASNDGRNGRSFHETEQLNQLSNCQLSNSQLSNSQLSNSQLSNSQLSNSQITISQLSSSPSSGQSPRNDTNNNQRRRSIVNGGNGNGGNRIDQDSNNSNNSPRASGSGGKPNAISFVGSLLRGAANPGQAIFSWPARHSVVVNPSPQQWGDSSDHPTRVANELNKSISFDSEFPSRLFHRGTSGNVESMTQYNHPNVATNGNTNGNANGSSNNASNINNNNANSNNSSSKNKSNMNFSQSSIVGFSVLKSLKQHQQIALAAAGMAGSPSHLDVGLPRANITSSALLTSRSSGSGAPQARPFRRPTGDEENCRASLPIARVMLWPVNGKQQQQQQQQGGRDGRRAIEDLPTMLDEQQSVHATNDMNERRMNEGRMNEGMIDLNDQANIQLRYATPDTSHLLYQMPVEEIKEGRTTSVTDDSYIHPLPPYFSSSASPGVATSSCRPVSGLTRIRVVDPQSSPAPQTSMLPLRDTAITSPGRHNNEADGDFGGKIVSLNNEQHQREKQTGFPFCDPMNFHQSFPLNGMNGKNVMNGISGTSGMSCPAVSSINNGSLIHSNQSLMATTPATQTTNGAAQSIQSAQSAQAGQALVQSVVGQSIVGLQSHHTNNGVNAHGGASAPQNRRIQPRVSEEPEGNNSRRGRFTVDLPKRGLGNPRDSHLRASHSVAPAHVADYSDCFGQSPNSNRWRVDNEEATDRTSRRRINSFDLRVDGRSIQANRDQSIYSKEQNPHPNSHQSSQQSSNPNAVSHDAVLHSPISQPGNPHPVNQQAAPQPNSQKQMLYEQRQAPHLGDADTHPPLIAPSPSKLAPSQFPQPPSLFAQPPSQFEGKLKETFLAPCTPRLPNRHPSWSSESSTEPQLVQLRKLR